MINFLTFRKDITEKTILTNGRRIFREGTIEAMEHEYKHDNILNITASVQSESEPSTYYEIELDIETDGTILESSCDCAYFRHGGNQICKHLIGTLYYVEAEGLFKTNAKKSKHDKKEEHKQKKEMVDVTLAMDFVNKELECQICLEILKKPIMMPCFMHSLCGECCRKLFATNKQIKRNNEVSCPTCSDRAGVFEINEVKELKPNKELERVIEAYNKERNQWFNEKNKLLNEINELKGGVSSKEENLLESKKKEELDEIIMKCKEMKKKRTMEEKNAKKEAKEFEKKKKMEERCEKGNGRSI